MLYPPPLRGDYSHIRTALCNQRLCTYRGGGLVVSTETTGAPVWRTLLDVHQETSGWLREHRASEPAVEVEMEAIGETLGPEGRERATTEEWMTGGGE